MLFDIFVKISQRSHRILDHWTWIFPIRDELETKQTSFQIFISKEQPTSFEGLKVENVFTIWIFSPIWGYLHPRAEVQKYHKKGCSHGISGSRRNRRYRKSCEKAWLRKFLAQQQPRRPGQDDEVQALTGLKSPNHTISLKGSFVTFWS